MSIIDTILFSFLLSVSVLLMVQYRQNQSLAQSICIGICWGLVLLTRFSGISLLCCSFFYIFANHHWKKAFVNVFAVIFGVLIVCGPWAYRNYQLCGKFIITTHGSVALWMAYNPNTYETIKQDISVDEMRSDMKTIPGLKELKFREDGSIQKEIKYSEFFLKLTLTYIKGNLWDSVSMMPLKFWKFWSPFLNPKHREQTVYNWAFGIIYTITYLPILILALVGIYWSRNLWRQHVIILLLFLGYSALHTIVFGFTRLRIPLDQFLIIYACYAVITFVFVEEPQTNELQAASSQ